MQTEEELLKQSKITPLFLHELFTLALAIKRNCEMLFNEAKIPEKGYVIQVDASIQSRLKAILDDAAQINNVLWPSPRRNNESEQMSRYRVVRGKLLRDMTGDIQMTEIKNHQVRDSLEHLDERLDRLSYELMVKGRKQGKALAFNIIVSTKSAFKPFPYPVKVYVSSERVFYNMQWRSDIGKIYTETCLILDKLKTIPGIKNADEPGGILLVKL